MVQEVSYKINDAPLTIIICNVLNDGFITLCFPHNIYLSLCIATCTTYMFTSQTKVSDINECEWVNDCDINSDCNNTDGSYNCTCHPGYSGNGRNCCEFTFIIV